MMKNISAVKVRTSPSETAISVLNLFFSFRAAATAWVKSTTEEEKAVRVRRITPGERVEKTFPARIFHEFRV